MSRSKSDSRDKRNVPTYTIQNLFLYFYEQITLSLYHYTRDDGYSWMCVYLQQLRLEDVIGRSVIVHGHADDFSTQPSGNSGEKIAFGIVEAWTL